MARKNDLNALAVFCNNYVTKNPAAQLANAIVKNVVLVIVEELSIHTPVDVGDALSGWQVSLDSPATTSRPAFVPSPKGRMVRGVWTHRVPPLSTGLANAPKVLDAARQVLTVRQQGQQVFVTNNADYITQLNNGSSQQEPAAFVERAELAGENELQRIKSALNGASHVVITPTGLII